MSTNEHRTRAIDSLQSLGLREYEAKCFVALAQLAEGTAKEVSKIAGVPRSRVYDSLERLQERGLVDVREANPRRYRGIPVETAVRTLQNEFEDYLETAGDNLSRLQASPRRGDDGLWTVSGTENVSERGRELVESAEREVLVVLPDSESVAGLSFDWIRRALDRGLRTFVDAASAAQRNDVESSMPDARVFVTERRDDDRSVGRTLLVDSRSALLSAVEGSLSAARTETAVVSDGGVGSRIVSLVEEASRSRRGSSPTSRIDAGFDSEPDASPFDAADVSGDDD